MKHSVVKNKLILACDRGDGWNMFEFSIFSPQGQSLAKENLSSFVFLPENSTVSTSRAEAKKASGMQFQNPFSYEIVGDRNGNKFEAFSDGQYTLIKEIETRTKPSKIVEVVSKPLPNGGGTYLSYAR